MSKDLRGADDTCRVVLESLELLNGAG